eukprot:scaffold35861_cov56-Phaeocystis_antarctica.AAC.3
MPTSEVEASKSPGSRASCRRPVTALSYSSHPPANHGVPPAPHCSRRTLASPPAECTSLHRSSVDADEGKQGWEVKGLRKQLNAGEGKEGYEVEAERRSEMEGERRAREADKRARESSRHEADRGSAPTGRGSGPKRERPEESVDLTSDGDEGPAEPSPPPRNEEPPARPRTTGHAPATQPLRPAPAPKPEPGSWKDHQLGARRASSGRFVCGAFGCTQDFVDKAALMEHRRTYEHWPKNDGTSEPREPEPAPAPADASRAAGRDRSASAPSSTPKTARNRDAVDLDEEPDEPVVTMQMRQVELGTFDCGACQVAFSEKAIRFYTAEATRFQPHGYHEEIELEMSALTRIEIDKDRGVMCITGFFGYAVEGHFTSFAVSNGAYNGTHSPPPERRLTPVAACARGAGDLCRSWALFHLVTGEGDGVWRGSSRDNQVKSLMRLSNTIKEKTGFNPNKRDFATDMRRFKRRQTGEEHAPKPPKAAAGRGSGQGSRQQSAAVAKAGGGSGSAGRSSGSFPGAGQRTDGKGTGGTPQIEKYFSGATPRPIERNNHRPQRSGPSRYSGGSSDRDFGGYTKRTHNEK